MGDHIRIARHGAELRELARTADGPNFPDGLAAVPRRMPGSGVE